MSYLWKITQVLGGPIVEVVINIRTKYKLVQTDSQMDGVRDRPLANIIITYVEIVYANLPNNSIMLKDTDVGLSLAGSCF